MFKKERLRQYLEDNKMSWRAFGERVGVTNAMIGWLIKGAKQPSAALLKRIAAEMGCSMDELME